MKTKKGGFKRLRIVLCVSWAQILLLDSDPLIFREDSSVSSHKQIILPV